MLLLGCLISVPAIAAADQGEVRRQCREWADSMFARPTDAKAREFAKCIAERDPESAEARAGRQAEALEEAARVARESDAEAERSEIAEREDAEAEARCGGGAISAFGLLRFCDSPAAVERKVAESDVIQCGPRNDCDRLKLAVGPIPLTAYPKYFAGGLYRITVYSPERSTAEFGTNLRRDWEGMVSVATEEYGRISTPAEPYPAFFAVKGVHIVTTHRWSLGRKRVRVGIFEGGEIYAAIMTVEDAVAAERIMRGD